MKRKVYRCFTDIEAESLDNARRGINALTEGNGDQFRIQEDPFSDEEEGAILELARLALSDAEVYDSFADKLDISDKELKKLQIKIEAVTNRQ